MDARPARPYDALRRKAKAQETRADIAAAARRLFTSRGWAATTVKEVAAEAGVSVPTVYAAYGSKTGLAAALADAADFAADPREELAALEAAQGDPAAQLAAMVAYDRRLFERAGDLVAMLREAGRTEPELAALYERGRAAADRVRAEVFGSWPAGVLATEAPRAVDRYAAVCGADGFAELTSRGWSPAEIEAWWAAVLARDLLA